MGKLEDLYAHQDPMPTLDLEYPVSYTYWLYLYEGHNHRPHEHEGRVQCGPQQEGEGQAALLCEFVDVSGMVKDRHCCTSGAPICPPCLTLWTVILARSSHDLGQHNY